MDVPFYMFGLLLSMFNAYSVVKFVEGLRITWAVVSNYAATFRLGLKISFCQSTELFQTSLDQGT